eukprot:scaffold119216_cov56-Phaeocystis_antarctica.AAC.2
MPRRLQILSRLGSCLAVVWTLRERQARRRSRVERAGGPCQPCNPVLGRPLHVGWSLTQNSENTRVGRGRETLCRCVVDVSLTTPER